MALISSIGEVNLDALDNSIADTAVDIFVYDTRKDSDGGKWRKRTKKTSWYNETLNTATRGSRREFPAVAVIVAESNQVTIYDGDDPDLPMWMVFNDADQFSALGWINDTCRAISMLNGILCVCRGGDNGVVHTMSAIKFIEDCVLFYQKLSGTNKRNGNISQRNNASTQGMATGVNINTEILVTKPANDVAMTVLPNAPIDPATGLPTPTIAVATDGGVSVIKDDGMVVDITWSNGNSIRNINFNKNNEIIFGVDFSIAAGGRYIKRYNIPQSDFSEGAYYSLNRAIETSSANGYSPSSSTSYLHPSYFVSEKDNTLNIGFSSGYLAKWFGLIKKNQNLYNYITSSYNTGWMHGDIKGAFLSDTDATNVTGTELITNGTFDGNDITGWIASTSGNGTTISGVNNGLRVQSDTSTYGSASTIVALESNTTYVLQYDLTSVGGTTAYYSRVGYGTSSTPPVGYYTNIHSDNRAVVGRNSFTFTTGTISGTQYLNFASRNDGTDFRYDNISLRKAELDRSVNNKGLQVFGTINKSPVAGSGATAAELVAYSGWSTSNYLEQPYNSDFNLTSTQDASWIIWFKNTESIETYYHFFDSGYVLDSAQPYWLIGLLGTGDGRPTFRLNGVTQQNLYGIGNYLDGSWHQIIVTRTGNGTLISMYIDGKLSSTLSTSPLEITHTSNAKLRIGLRGGTNNRQNTGGYLTQLRFSKSAPTAEQIKKIYEDEKVLFQENAACTLYGSSDAVTALAYDDKTNLLHVGTSSGRSDFKGLRRINNTTTGITTAISASNRLIAEQ